tara:strand:- start:812 stop:1006 length:195 start_codon:yes stop_codon:yes gene_type:complete
MIKENEKRNNYTSKPEGGGKLCSSSISICLGRKQCKMHNEVRSGASRESEVGSALKLGYASITS